jgi:tripartite-type tricarboxylate transporter receptor subunit TctC
VPGYSMANWYGLFGPRGLPQPVVARLEKELAAMRTNELMVQRTKAAGITLKLTGADVLRERMATEVPRWKKIAADLNLTAK